MNTLKIKSILATLIMVLASGSAWADNYEDYWFNLNGPYTGDYHEWTINVESGDMLTFDWVEYTNYYSYSSQLYWNIEPYNNNLYTSTSIPNDDYSGTVTIVFNQSGEYMMQGNFYHDGNYETAWNSAWIGNIMIYKSKSYNGLVFLTIPNTTDAYLSGCSLSGDVTIPASFEADDGKTYNVVGIRKDAFKDCTTITSVTIPSSVTSLPENTFSGCANLTSVTIPSSITRLPEYMFSGCIYEA